MAAHSDQSHSPTDGDEALRLVEHLAENMAERWRNGERPLVEDYLALHPELWNLPNAALELISEEIYLRHENRIELPSAAWLGRFPQWQRQVQALLSCHSFLATPVSASRFPLEGETLGEFRLAAELGRGAHARVYLATQSALADRPVVLKLTPRAGGEHLSLARLQHTNIVPLYSVHDFLDRGLRGLCLPYFGGVTLARFLEDLSDRPPWQRAGRDIAGALERAPSLGVGASPACRFLARASYAQAICWIGASLADGLQYAHERGLVHLDIKPPNVLLAADGQPMLLDFHLARAPLAEGDPAPAWLGGTPGHMAPEQEAALEAVRAGRLVPAAVDTRADIYALGLLLYELLGGTLPPTPPSEGGGEPSERPAVTLRRRNPQVTPGLANLVAKCLATDPKDRYADAAALAADLRRHLADLPLRGVANRSPAERWRKWQRRHPYGILSLALLLVLSVGAVLLCAQSCRQAQKARSALQEGQQRLQQGRYAEAFDTLKYGLALADGLPLRAGLIRRLREEMRLAERGKAAGELHVFCEQIRPLYGASNLPLALVHAVDGRCRELWQKRELITRMLGAKGGAPSFRRETVRPPLSSLTKGGKEEVNELDLQVRIDLLDLAIVWTSLSSRPARYDDVRLAHPGALEILAEAEELFGRSCVLYRERARQARALGMIEVAEAAERQACLLTPRTAWEHYALGRAYFLGGEVPKAADEMEKALELEPQELWPNFYKGCCAHQLGRYRDAVTAFSICVVLAPQSGWCFHNRGLAYLELGRFDQALHDFERALSLDPSLAAARLSRGIVHYRQQRYSEALADLQRALDQGVDRTAVYYHQALVHLARQDQAAALASLQQALQRNPHHQPSQELLAQLRQTD